MYRRVGAVVGLVVLATLVAPVTAPVSVSFVNSGSMEPTIVQGDGFVLVPADDVRPGDVVTFYSEHRREYVTHRVVDATEEGYITRGDANPSADQASGHPPVTRDAIVGEVLVVAGHLVVVPGLGAVVEFVSTNRELLVAAALAAGVAFARRSGSRPARPVVTSRELFRSLFAVGVVVTVALILFGGTTVAIPVGDSPADAGPRGVVVDEGGTTPVDFETSESTFLARTVTADGARVAGTERGEQMTVTLADVATADGEVRVSFYSYPPVLSDSTLAALQRIHPALAALASVLVTYLPVYGTTHLLFGGREPLRMPRWLRRRGGGS